MNKERLIQAFSELVDTLPGDVMWVGVPDKTGFMFYTEDPGKGWDSRKEYKVTISYAGNMSHRNEPIVTKSNHDLISDEMQ